MAEKEELIQAYLKQLEGKTVEIQKFRAAAEVGKVSSPEENMQFCYMPFFLQIAWKIFYLEFVNFPLFSFIFVSLICNV